MLTIVMMSYPSNGVDMCALTTIACTQVGPTAILDTSVDPRFIDTRNR